MADEASAGTKVSTTGGFEFDVTETYEKVRSWMAIAVRQGDPFVSWQLAEDGSVLTIRTEHIVAFRPSDPTPEPFAG